MTRFNNTKPSVCEATAILRRLALLHFCCREFGTIDSISEYLRASRLGVSDRQLERILSETRKVFGLARRKTLNGRVHFCYRPPKDWYERLTLRQVDKGIATTPVNGVESEIILEPKGRNRGEDAGLVEKMIRIMLIVETLPVDDMDVQGISVKRIRSVLVRKGVVVSTRTVQRDLKFIKQHFLVLECAGGGRRKLWKRMEWGDWTDNFEPRFPRFAFEDVSVVARFLYGRRETSLEQESENRLIPDAWIRAVERLH